MSRTDNKPDATQRHSNEGTAARTRPISFEEIMSRRKMNVDSEVKQRASGLIESSEKNDVNGAVTDGGLKSDREFVSAVKSNLNRFEENEKVRGHLKKLEKDVNVNSKRHEEKYSTKGNSRRFEGVSKTEKEHLVFKDKRNRDSEASMKLGVSYGKSGRDREGRTEKERHHKSRSSNQSGADAEMVSELKQMKRSSEKDKHEERDRRHGKEGKRKHEAYIDDKVRSTVDASSLKKHDSGKLRDTEYSERKDRKKEHFKARPEELGLKRRRSRSREYERQRERSLSASPRAHRRSYHGREYDEPSSQPFKDSSRRKYSETDKLKASGNGGYGSGPYWKHGSGLGGYSPRKRRTETTVKTPSPSKHPSPSTRSPERKGSTWDQLPAEASQSGTVTVLASLQAPSSKTFESTSLNTVIQAATKVQPIPTFEAASMLFSASIDSVQLTQATRPRRQLYIENLPPSVSEKSVIDCLNDFLLSCGFNRIQGAKPCISCIINKDKCQAVVEFLTPEDATSAITFDGRSLLGSVLKIRRPKDFVEAPTGAEKRTLPEETVPTVKTLSEIVKDSPHKIFIGGISKALTSDMLLEVVSAFGVLKAYRFEFIEELNGPCAFIEYEDHSITQKACAGLNGMKLSGQVLTAVVACVDFHGKEDDGEDLLSYDVPFHAKSLLGDSTRVLQLKNVFNSEEFLLLTESELEETLEDIRLECTRFGTVKSINVVRFTGKCEGASVALDRQDSHDEPSTIRTSSPMSSCKDGDATVNTSSNINELEDVKDFRENANIYRESLVEDYEREANIISESLVEESERDANINSEGMVEDSERESANPCTTVTDGVFPQSEDISSTAKELGVAVEESFDLKCEVLTEAPPVGDDITAGEFDASNSHSSSRENEKIPSEDTKPEMFATDLGASDGNKHQTTDLFVFEPGSVLVEFLREEAACNAAHCLHQRIFGERIVSAGYVSRDLYMEHFPR